MGAAFVGVLVFALIREIRTSPLVPVLPTCRVMSPEGTELGYRELPFDQTTRQFRNAMRLELQSIGWDVEEYLGHLRVSLAGGDATALFNGDGLIDSSELFAHWASFGATLRLMQPMLDNASISPGTLEEYVLTNPDSGTRHQLDAGDCGLMEEFILKGGRFAHQ